MEEDEEPYPYTIYVLLDLHMIAADIILSRVMINPITLCEKNNDADQPTHLHSLF